MKRTSSCWNVPTIVASVLSYSCLKPLENPEFLNYATRVRLLNHCMLTRKKLTAETMSLRLLNTTFNVEASKYLYVTVSHGYKNFSRPFTSEYIGAIVLDGPPTDAYANVIQIFKNCKILNYKVLYSPENKADCIDCIQSLCQVKNPSGLKLLSSFTIGPVGYKHDSTMEDGLQVDMSCLGHVNKLCVSHIPSKFVFMGCNELYTYRCCLPMISFGNILDLDIASRHLIPRLGKPNYLSVNDTYSAVKDFGYEAALSNYLPHVIDCTIAYEESNIKSKIYDFSENKTLNRLTIYSHVEKLILPNTMNMEYLRLGPCDTIIRPTEFLGVKELYINPIKYDDLSFLINDETEILRIACESESNSDIDLRFAKNLSKLTLSGRGASAIHTPSSLEHFHLNGSYLTQKLFQNDFSNLITLNVNIVEYGNWNAPKKDIYIDLRSLSLLDDIRLHISHSRCTVDLPDHTMIKAVFFGDIIIRGGRSKDLQIKNGAKFENFNFCDSESLQITLNNGYILDLSAACNLKNFELTGSIEKIIFNNGHNLSHFTLHIMGPLKKCPQIDICESINVEELDLRNVIITDDYNCLLTPSLKKLIIKDSIWEGTIDLSECNKLEDVQLFLRETPIVSSPPDLWIMQSKIARYKRAS